jgi:hypothetical protein
MSLRRHTFIIQVREPDGTPMLENLRTHERVLVRDLSEIGGQIGRWLEPNALGPPGEDRRDGRLGAGPP